LPLSFSTYHCIQPVVVIDTPETRSTITKKTSQPDAQVSPTYASIKHVPTYASTNHVPTSPTYASTKHIPRSPTYASTKHVPTSPTYASTKNIPRPPTYHHKICVLIKYHNINDMKPTIYLKHMKNHVHKHMYHTMYHVSIKCINTCTIPCINHIPYQIHQPCTILSTSTYTINHVP
jgi:hypothetical protein